MCELFLLVIFGSTMIASKRNEAIDILKFVAVILVAHSHMDALYPRYSFICTGGAIGDAIFFFISGYTLFCSSRWGRFDNWYKRRIQRIYPTIIAWAVIACAAFGVNQNAMDVMLSGGGYFVSCIMVFYMLIYWIGKYLKNYIQYACLLCVALVIGVFLLCPDAVTDNMYSSISAVWPIWNFMFMLLGATIAVREQEGCQTIAKSAVMELLLAIMYLIAYYVILYIAARLHMQWLQVVGLLPLTGLVFHLYLLAKSESVKNVYHKRGVRFLIYSLGQLCLEVYIIQYYLISGRWNDWFPINVFVTWIVVFGVAYMLKVCSNLVAQTFRAEDYDWKKMFKL